MSNKIISETRLGELLILSAVALGSLLFVLVNPGSTHLGPFWLAAFSTTLALLPITFLMIKNNLWYQLRNREAVKYSIIAGLIVGTLYYSLIHWGSYHTSPQNAAILACFEMFTAMFLLRKKSNERLTLRESSGTVLLLGAIGLIFLPDSSEPRIGDFVLLAAGFVSPFGNWFMKRARSSVSSVTIMWTRSVVGAFMLFLIAISISDIPSAHELLEAAPVLLINGILVLGISKLFWIEGIYRIAIAKACALSALGPILTFIFAWLILGKLPNWGQTIALPPAIIGVYLIMSGSKKAD